MDPGCADTGERYRALFESLDCVFVQDLEGKFLDANDPCLEFTGYTREELLKLDVSSLLDEEQTREAHTRLRRLQESPEPGERAEFRIRRKNGEYAFGEITASLVSLEGRPYAVLGVVRDVTKLREAERALADQNAALLRLNRLAIDISLSGSVDEVESLVVRGLIDITGGAAAGFSAYDPAAGVITVRHVEAAPTSLDSISRLLDGPLIGFQAVISDAVYRTIVSRVVQASGDVHEASYGSVPREAGAAIQALLGVDRFVSIGHLVEGSLYGVSIVALAKGSPDPPESILENFGSFVALAFRRRRAEAALRESEERHRLLTENTSDVIWTIDTAGRFTYVSPSVERLRGYTAAELLGQPVTASLTPESAVVAQAVLAEALEAIKAGLPVAEFRRELQQPRKDGSIIWTEHIAGELRDASGRWIGFAGVTRDITERKKAEEALQQSESKYRTVVDNMREGVVVASTSRILYCNDRVPELLGYTTEELAGLEFGAAVHPDDRVAAFSRLSSIIERGSATAPSELRLLTKTGDTRTMSVHASTIDWQGEPAVIVFMESITEQKLAEAYQELSREILEILNEPGHTSGAIEQVLATIKASTGFDAVGIRLEDGADYPYVAADGYSEEFFETENSLFERDENGGLRRDESGNAILACMCGLVISGKTDPARPDFTRGGSFWTNDVSVLLKQPPGDDPRVCPRESCIQQGYACMALVPIKDKQRIVGVLHLSDRRKGRLSLDAVGRLEGIAAHIGAALLRMKAERALQESQERYQTLVNLSPDAVVVDVDGRFVFANAASARLFGAGSPRELIGLDVLERTHPDYRAIISERAAQVAAGGVSVPREVKIVRLDGTAAEVEATAARIEFDGRWARLVVFRDITERKQAEARQRELERRLQERQKLESLGVLAGGIAHDFNNMLTAIIGYSDLILASGLSSPEETLADVGEIREAAERAKALTGAILAFSRRQPREPQILALDRLVADLKPLLRRTLGEDINMVFNLPVEACLVEADPSQLTQVLMNLVVNARDAMASGGTLTLEVGSRQLDEQHTGISPVLTSGQWSVLTVSDTGAGIDAAVLSRVFEPFFTTKRPGEGTGLGLATAYGIVRQSGGDIVAASEVGRGSVFEVYLPCVGAAMAEAEEDAVARPEVPRPAEMPPAMRATILVVEDEPAVRRLATRLLEEQGYTVLVASDGRQALSFARDQSLDIDLVLTDVVLPGELQGDEVARIVLRVRPGVKVIFMSGYPRNVMLPSGRLDEGINYLDKPFTAESLGSKVKEALEAGA